MDDFINSINVYIEPSERITQEDKIYMDISRWARKIFESEMEYWDELVSKLINITFYTSGNLKGDHIYEYKHTYDRNVVIPMSDDVDTGIHLVFRDYVNLEDIIYKDNM
jgi:hypothetical protein